MRFATSFTVSAAPDVVYAYLMDPSHYVGLAPLVVAVRDIHQVDSTTIGYVAVERFRLGPFHWDNQIRVTMTGDAAAHAVTSRVVSPGGVRLNATVTLTPAAGGSSAVEDVDVRAPWFLRRYVLAKAREAAAGRAAELTRRMAQDHGEDQLSR